MGVNCRSMSKRHAAACSYSDADLAAWAERLAATQWQEVHAYFMHEPTAPGYAAALLEKFQAP